MKDFSLLAKWQVCFWRIVLRLPLLRRHPMLQAFKRLSQHVSGPNLKNISYCTAETYGQYLTPALPLQRLPNARTSNGIPHIIHCCFGLWDRDDAIPLTYVDKVKTWKTYHPDWEIYLWNRPAIEHLIHHQFPQFFAPFSQAPRVVQQADLARYLIIYACGGLYVDMDLQCLQSTMNLFWDFPEANMYVSTECELTPIECLATSLYSIRQGIPELPLRIANYWMAAAPNHPVMFDLLTLVTHRLKLPIHSQYDILYTTGGDAMTETIHRSKPSHPGLTILTKGQSDQFMKHFAFGGWREQAI
jgi:mannosyltransferase OCH1-like enzyme